MNKLENDERITRKEFLKRTALGAFSLVVLSKFGIPTVHAATVTDNLEDKGTHIGSTPPANLTRTWIDTNNDGVMKYWNGSAWAPIRSTWDE